MPLNTCMCNACEAPFMLNQQNLNSKCPISVCEKMLIYSMRTIKKNKKAARAIANQDYYTDTKEAKITSI